MWKLLGVFELRPHRHAPRIVYSLAVLFVLFVFARRLVNSPFGLSLRGVRENVKRMPAIGAPVDAAADRRSTRSARRWPASPAGCSRRRRSSSASTCFGFPRSADLLIMLVLGGIGRLYGALVGAAVFMIAQDYLSDLNPIYWQFWLGLLLVVVVLFARGGILGALDDVVARVAREHEMSRAALRTEGLSKQFGAFKANSDVTLSLPPGARHALIGPNGAGKTTLINLLTGVLRADARATCSSATSTSPACRSTSASSAA